MPFKVGSNLTLKAENGGMLYYSAAVMKLKILSVAVKCHDFQSGQMFKFCSRPYAALRSSANPTGSI